MTTSRSKTVKTETLAHVWDVIHYVRMGEIRDVSFLWYRMKFKCDVSEKTAAREWERFKKLVRDLAVPHERLHVEDEESGAPITVIRFKPEALDFMEKKLERRKVPEDDERVWVSRIA